MTDLSIAERAKQISGLKSGFGDLKVPSSSCLSATARVTEGTR
jgi:hypothetical protein